MRNATLAVLGVLAAAGTATAQSQVLYLGDQGAGVVYRVQGGSILDSWTPIGGGSESGGGMAVTDRVRIAPFTGGTVQDYSLTGAYLGAVGSGGGAGGGSGYTFEGTTDGTYNYVANYGSSGVTRWDGAWSSGSAVSYFSTALSGIFGIAYDSGSDTFWVSQISSNGVAQYDRSGNELQRWTVPTTDHNLLAYEGSSGTLWQISRSDNVLRQYSTGGSLLNSYSLGTFSNVLSIEFSVEIPAPGALALLGIGGLAAARRRR